MEAAAVAAARSLGRERTCKLQQEVLGLASGYLLNNVLKLHDTVMHDFSYRGGLKWWDGLVVRVVEMMLR